MWDHHSPTLCFCTPFTVGAPTRRRPLFFWKLQQRERERERGSVATERTQKYLCIFGIIGINVQEVRMDSDDISLQ